MGLSVRYGPGEMLHRCYTPADDPLDGAPPEQQTTWPMHETPVGRASRGILATAFHVGNTGSNPVGDVSRLLSRIRVIQDIAADVFAERVAGVCSAKPAAINL